MLAVPPNEEPLAAPREATTLWRDAAANGDLRVGTLAQMGQLPLEACGPGEYVEVDEAANCTVIQIVKREGSYVAVVDGVVVQSFQHGGRDVYPVVAHRGLHTDPFTTPFHKAAHAFSPCAVAVVIEDGQLPPSECRLCVWQQIGDVAAPMDVPRLAGDVPLLHTVVASNLSNVLYAPYPMAHGRKPRVILYDMRKAMATELAGMKSAAKIMAQSSGGRVGIRNFVNGIIQGNAPIFNSFARRVGLEFVDPGPVNGEEAGFLGRAFEFAAGALGQETAATAEEKARVAMEKQKIKSLVELPVLLAQLIGNPIGIMLANVFAGRTIAVETGDNVPDFAAQGGYKTVEFLGILDGAVSGLIALMSTPVVPKPSKVYFTLDELAESLETLASTVMLSKADMRRVTSESSFRREALVWSWLLHSNNKVLGMLKTDNSGFFANSTMDTSELGTNGLPPAQRAPLITTISVEVVDSNICGGQTLDFEFLCQSSDAPLLALARQGMLASLDRIYHAVQALEERLSEAIANNMERSMGRFADTKLGEDAKLAYWFWDQFATGPWGLFLYDAFLKTTGVAKLTDKMLQMFGLTEFFSSIDQQRVGLLQIVLSNVGTKLVTAFVSPNSQARRLYNSITRAVNRATPPGQLVQRKPLRVLRQLPHKAKRAGQLYPRVETFPSDTYDIETAELLTREKSAYAETVREVSHMFSREQATLRHLIDLWERGPTRLVLKTAHASSQAFPTLGVAFAPLRDSYGLVLQLPADVQLASEALSESDRRRMQLISDRSQLSALKRVFRGAKEAESTFAALAVYSEFWTDELVRRGRAANSLAEKARSFAQASHVAAGIRAEACAQLVLDTTPQSPVGFFNDSDPIFKATQQGRDAFILARRLGGLNNATDALGIRWLREVASELFRIAKMTSNSGFPVVPSEPLQSMFMDPAHGEFAHQRARLYAAPHATTQRGVLIVRSIASSYPSLLIPRRAGTPPLPPAPAPTRPPAVAIADDAGVRAALVERAAKLRLDFPLVDAHEADNVRRLTERFGAMDFGSAAAAGPLHWTALSGNAAQPAGRAHFSVPYGFGDAPPPLTSVPISAIMFGSVPVWTADWRFALLDVIALLDPTDADAAAQQAAHPADASRLVAQLQPQQRELCNSNDALAGPSILRANASSYTFFASSVRSQVGQEDLRTFVNRPNANGTLPAPQAAASDHTQERRTLALSRAVAEIAWNAERTLQCLLLAVARQGTAINVAGALPPDPPPPPPRQPGRTRDTITKQHERTWHLLKEFTRQTLRALKDVIKEVRELNPRDEDLTWKARWIGAPEEGAALSDVSDVRIDAHVDVSLDSSLDAARIDEASTDAGGQSALTALKKAAGAASLIAQLTSIVRAAAGIGPAAAALAASAAAAIGTSTAAAALAVAAVGYLGDGLMQRLINHVTLKGNALLEDLLKTDVDALSDEDLFVQQTDLGTTIDNVYLALLADDKWATHFESKWKAAATSGKTDTEIAKIMQGRMKAALNQYRADPNKSGDTVTRLFANVRRHSGKLSTLQVELERRFDPAANVLGALARSNLQRAKAQRRRLMLSYVLGMTMARVLLGADDRRALRFVTLPHPGTPAEVAENIAGLKRLLATIDGGPGALRFGEACCISELVTV